MNFYYQELLTWRCPIILQIVKSSSAPRVPECFQKLPKKVTICENGQIVAVNVDNEGNNYLTFIPFM